MEKHQLAQELRLRQYAHGRLSRHLIDAISDDDLIDSYITCSCCGEKQVTAQELGTAIGLATTANHFFDLCERFASTRMAQHPPHHPISQGTTRRFGGSAKKAGKRRHR